VSTLDILLTAFAALTYRVRRLASLPGFALFTGVRFNRLQFHQEAFDEKVIHLAAAPDSDRSRE
jgi:hypothetical protein